MEQPGRGISLGALSSPADAAAKTARGYWVHRAHHCTAEAQEMLAIDKLVPGFDTALAAIPDGTEMARVLDQSTEEGNLTARTAALIRVAVSQRAGGPYARWAMQRLAAREWIGAEDIFFASAG